MKFRRTYLTDVGILIILSVWMLKCYLILNDITGKKWSMMTVGCIQEILDYGFQVGALRLSIGKFYVLILNKESEGTCFEILHNTTWSQIAFVHCQQEKKHFQAGAGRIYCTREN